MDVDVSGRHDRARAEAADDLAEPADVVDDGGNAGPEHLQQGSGDVDLGPVGKERDGRLRESAAQLRLREVSESPLRAVPGCAAETVERHARVPDDEEPGAVDAEHRLHGVLGPLVRTDEPETEGGAPVVGVLHVGAEDRVRDDAELLGGEAEVDELPSPALRVHDDPVEALEERSPQCRLRQRSPGDDVVGGEDGRASRSEEPAVGLGRAEPLDVDQVWLRKGRGGPCRAGARAP